MSWPATCEVVVDHVPPPEPPDGHACRQSVEMQMLLAESAVEEAYGMITWPARLMEKSTPPPDLPMKNLSVAPPPAVCCCSPYSHPAVFLLPSLVVYVPVVKKTKLKCGSVLSVFINTSRSPYGALMDTLPVRPTEKTVEVDVSVDVAMVKRLLSPSVAPL